MGTLPVVSDATTEARLGFMGRVAELMGWEWQPTEDRRWAAWRAEGKLIEPRSGLKLAIDGWWDGADGPLCLKYYAELPELKVEPRLACSYGEEIVTAPEGAAAVLEGLSGDVMPTWEAMKARRREIEAEGNVLAAAIAAEMGEGWSGTVETDDNRWVRYEVKLKKDRATINFTWSLHGHWDEPGGTVDRYRIGGEFPWELRDYWRMMRDSITCTAQKTPKQIAGDIKRRLLPDYMEALAKAEAAKVKEDARQATVQSVGARLVAASNGFLDARTNFNGREQEGEYSLSLRGSSTWGSVKVSSGGSDVTLDLRVSPEQAEAMLAALVGVH